MIFERAALVHRLDRHRRLPGCRVRTGALLFGQTLQGGLCFAVAIGTGIGLVRVVPKIWNDEGRSKP